MHRGGKYLDPAHVIQVGLVAPALNRVCQLRRALPAVMQPLRACRMNIQLRDQFLHLLFGMIERRDEVGVG